MAQTSFYSRNYIGWPPVPLYEFNNPDSNYWSAQSFVARDRLIATIGGDEYLTWIDEIYPGNDICRATWKELHDLYIEKLAEVRAQS